MRFDPAETRSAAFSAAGGATQAMQLMHRLGGMAYAQSPPWQAVDLGYGNGAFTMTVVLPKGGADVETVAGSLRPATWLAHTSTLVKTKVDVSLPRLRLCYERFLNDDLQSLGMRAPFLRDVADFTQMSPLGNHLYLEFVKQMTFVDVNEEGTTGSGCPRPSGSWESGADTS